MGKSSKVAPVSYRDDPDAVSLHTTPGDYEDAPEISAEPPAYSDSEPFAASDARHPVSSAIPGHVGQYISTQPFEGSVLGKPIEVNGVQLIMDSSCDKDPVYLQKTLENASIMPPKPQIHIIGTHKETRRRNNKNETEQITDFRFDLDMTPYLFQDFNPPCGKNFKEVRTVENGDKTYRGGIFKSRAPGYKADLEVGDPKAALQEWCHLYCASHSSLKVFRLERKVTGMDEEHFKNRLEGIIRTTGYKGHISITFPIHQRYADSYSNTRINQWRHTTWIRWIFYLTFLWIFAWPYLLFATKWWAPIVVEWPFARVDAHGRKIYTTCSEEEWLTRFSAAVRQLALDHFNGEASEEYLSQVMSRPETQRQRSSNAGNVNDLSRGINGLRSGGLVGAVSGVNSLIRFGGVGGSSGQQDGWGYDT